MAHPVRSGEPLDVLQSTLDGIVSLHPLCFSDGSG